MSYKVAILNFELSISTIFSAVAGIMISYLELVIVPNHKKFIVIGVLVLADAIFGARRAAKARPSEFTWTKFMKCTRDMIVYWTLLLIAFQIEDAEPSANWIGEGLFMVLACALLGMTITNANKSGDLKSSMLTAITDFIDSHKPNISKEKVEGGATPSDEKTIDNPENIEG